MQISRPKAAVLGTQLKTSSTKLSDTTELQNSIMSLATTDHVSFVSFVGSKKMLSRNFHFFSRLFHQNRSRERATSRISANFFFRDIRKSQGVRKK